MSEWKIKRSLEIRTPELMIMNALPTDTFLHELMDKSGKDEIIVTVTYTRTKTSYMSARLREAYIKYMCKFSAEPAGYAVSSDLYEQFREECQQHVRTYGSGGATGKLPPQFPHILSFDGVPIYEIPGLPPDTLKVLM